MKPAAAALLALAMLTGCASTPDADTPDMLWAGPGDPAATDAATVWATQGWRVTHVDGRRLEWDGRPAVAFAVRVPAGEYEFSFSHQSPAIKSFHRLRARVEAGREYRFHGIGVHGTPPVFEIEVLEPGKRCTVNYNENVRDKLVFC